MKGFVRNRKIYIFAGLILVLFFSSCGDSEKYVPESSLRESAHSQASQTGGAIDQTPEIFVQMGHIDDGYTANTVADFTPDGRHVLTGSKDGTVKLWETETGKEVKTFRGQGRVTDVVISEDGRYVVIGNDNFVDNLNLWEISSGGKVRSFPMEVLNGPPAVFCDNDRRLVAGGKAGVLRLWDIESGEIVREFKLETESEVRSVVLTPDGKKIIAGYGRDQEKAGDSIKVWDIDTGHNILSFNNGGETIALAITPDGKHLLSADWGQDRVNVWEIESGKHIKSYTTSGTSAIAISAGGSYALFGGYMNFRLVAMPTGKVIRNINKGIRDWVQSIKFSPDGRYALVGDQVPQPKLWDLSSGELLKTFGGYAGGTITARTVGKNILMTAHGYSNSASLWDYKNGVQLKIIKNDAKCLLSSASVSDDGTKVAFGGYDMSADNTYMSVWNAETSEKIIKIPPPSTMQSHPKSPLFSKDGKKIFWASGAKVIISNAEDGSMITTLDLGFRDIDKMSIDPSERYLLVYTQPPHTTLVDIKTNQIVKTFDRQWVFSHDGRKLYALKENFEGNTVVVNETDLSTLKEKKLFETGFNAVIGRGEWKVYNYIKTIAAGGDKDQLFFSDKDVIYKVDLKKATITARLEGHTEEITNIEITPDGSFLCSSSRDGTTRLWNVETGKEVARFVSFSDGEWIVVTPEGYFNASPNGAKYLNVRVGDQVLSIDNFYERYYQPAYVASVLQGKEVRPAADIRKGVALPPDVKIISPADGSEFRNDEVEITVSSKDMGGGIDEIRLYHNGKAIGGAARGVKIVPAESKEVKSYVVTLVDGLNTFRAVGFSSDRTESHPDEITIKLAAPEKKVSLYILAVGINKYKNPALNLNYAEPDAKGIADFFRKSGTGLFKNIEIADIYNDQATKKGIVAELKKLQSINKQDAVLIYLAGHGENISEEWYFIPYELTYPERQEDVKEKSVSSDELSGLIRDIKAQKILILIDACKSGAALYAFRGFEDRKALSQLSRATGVHVVAASSKDQFAAEVKDIGHGVFTYTLLEGLNGKAAAKGETLTVRKLMGYIEEELPEVTKKYRQEAQYPVIDSQGMDFPLVKVK